MTENRNVPIEVTEKRQATQSQSNREKKENLRPTRRNIDQKKTSSNHPKTGSHIQEIGVRKNKSVNFPAKRFRRDFCRRLDRGAVFRSTLDSKT